MSTSALIGALRVNLGLDSAEFQNGVKQAQAQAKGFERAMLAMGAKVAAAFAGVMAVGELGRAADEWSDLSSRVGIAVGQMDLAPAVMGRISDIARMTYSSIQQTTDGFVANAASLSELGYSTADALDYTEALNNALVVSGAKGDRAASVQRALSNAMATGKLSGDGLNSVLSNGGRIAQLLADELDTTRNGLIEMARQGKITSDVIGDALLGSMEDLRAEAESMPATIGDGIQLIKNSFLQLVGSFDQASGASSAVSNVLVLVADGITALGIVMRDIGTVIGGFVEWLGELFASANEAGNGMLSLSDTLKNLFDASIIGRMVKTMQGFASLIRGAGGFGNALELVGDVAREAVARMSGYFQRLGLQIDRVYLGVRSSALQVTASILDNGVWFANRYVGVYRGAFGAIQTIWGALPAVMGDIVYSTVNNVISGIGDMVSKAAGMIDWLTGGVAGFLGKEGTNLASELGDLFNGIENPFAGAAASAGQAAADAFLEGFGTDTFDGSGISDGLRNTAANAAIAAQTAGQQLAMMQQGAGSAWTSIQALRDAMAAGTVDADELADSLNNVLTDPLAGGGATGGGSGSATDRIKAMRDAIKDMLDTLNAQTKAGADAMSNLFLSLKGGIKGLKSAFGDLALQIAKTFSQSAFQQLAGGGGWWGSIASGLGSLLGGVGKIGKNANGTNNWRGGLTQINERGGEIVDLPRGTRIIPHDVSNRMADQAERSAVDVRVSVDNNGNLQAYVQQSAAQVSAQQLAAYDRAMPSRVHAIAAKPRMR